MVPEVFRDIPPGPLSRDDAAQLNRALEIIRRLTNLSVAPPLSLGDGAGGPHLTLGDDGGVSQGWVQIASLTETSGRYPGARYEFKLDDSTWTQKEDVWIVSANNEVLTLTTKFQARLMGQLSGKPVYLLNPGRPEVVKITGPAVAGVYPGKLQKWDGSTWVDDDVIDVIEINGANLSGWAGGIYDWGED